MLKDGVFGRLSDSGQALVDMAHRNSQRLLMLLNDLLDLSRIEAGKLSINPGKCNLRHELEDIVELFKAQADEKDLNLEYRFHADIADFVVADSARIYQILINLVGNAIKYTEKGGILVDVRLEDTLPEIFIKFRVIDSGIGVSDDQKLSIFDKFVQGDGSASRKYGGTGLGLAICKYLVEAMAGRIGVESIVEGGSVFWFKLPYRPFDASEAMLSVTDPASSCHSDKMSYNPTRH
jgi:two-component system sensor histidine kinase BarA